jgi:drug/metabolite transporter (DMT)-like permease
VLGSILAILSAASFALNNATVRRGVVSGTPIQAMAVSVPLGVACFLPLVFLTGELFRLPQFPKTPWLGWPVSACCISYSGATAIFGQMRSRAST